MRSILSHFSLFRLNKQGVIFRIFVYKDNTTFFLIYINDDDLNKRIKETHDALGHANGRAVFALLSKKWFAPGLRRKIDEILKVCTQCLKYNPKKFVKEKQGSLLTTNSRRILQMDLSGPLPTSKGWKYIWVGVDCYDKSVFLRGLKSTSGEDMGNLLAKFFSEEGIYEFVQVDYKCLTIKGVDKVLLDKMGVGIIRSNHCSRHQGVVERMIQSMRNKILKFLGNETDLQGWGDVLPVVQFALNATPVASLGWRSSHQLRYVRPPTLLLPPITEVGEKRDFRFLVRLADDVRKGAYNTVVRNKQYFHPHESLRKGQIVWKKRLAFNRNLNSKLQEKVTEAFQVLDRVGTGMYRIKKVGTDEIQVVPVDHLIRTNLSLEQVKLILREIGV